MNKKILIYICSGLLFLFIIIFYYHSIDVTVLFPTDIKGCVEKYWKTKLNVVVERDYVLNGKNYKIILSTSTNNKRYKYFNIYEKKIGGLYYKSYTAANQGQSNSDISFMLVELKYGFKIQDYLTIVYGYNEGLMVDNYRIRVAVHGKDDGYIKQSYISENEYFIDVYKGYFKGIVSCVGKDGRNMIKCFED